VSVLEPSGAVKRRNGYQTERRRPALCAGLRPQLELWLGLVVFPTKLNRLSCGSVIVMGYGLQSIVLSRRWMSACSLTIQGTGWLCYWLVDDGVVAAGSCLALVDTEGSQHNCIVE
jgi:hypothetical protein